MYNVGQKLATRYCNGYMPSEVGREGARERGSEGARERGREVASDWQGERE
jgi:hypothetical protein